MLASVVAGGGCSFEEEHCSFQYEISGALSGTYESTDATCGTTIFPYQVDLAVPGSGMSVEIDSTTGGGFVEGSQEVDVEWRSGSTWFDSGDFSDPVACTLVLDTLATEEWSQGDRARMSGTLSCAAPLVDALDGDASVEFSNFEFSLFQRVGY